MERGRGSYGGRSSYRGRGNYHGRDSGTYQGRDSGSYGIGEGNAGHYTSDGRYGNTGRSSYGGRRGRFYQHPQLSGGNEHRSPSQPQPQERWQRKLNPSSPGESSEPHASQPRPETETETGIETEKRKIQNPDVGSLRISEEKAESIRPMRRPDKGGKIAAKRNTLEVNHFLVEFDEKRVIFHYDVDVKAKAPSMNNRPQKISKFLLSSIRDKLFSDHALPTSAYDGDKSIFSSERLKEGTFDVEVVKGGEARTLCYSVSLKLVKDLELRKLRDYLSGKVPGTPADVLQGLNLVGKENPSKQCDTVGCCFFPKNHPISPEDSKGIIATGGFQQSLKTTSQGLSLCVDFSVLSYFGEEKPVLKFLHEQIENFDLRKFPKFKKKVEDLLVGLKVKVTHRTTMQKYTITKLTPMVTSKIRFPVLDTEGRNPAGECSLIDYFCRKHNVEIQHTEIPALDFGGNKMNYVPMELCILIKDQRCPKENLLNTDAGNVLRRMSLATAGERRSKICTIVKSEEGPCGPHRICFDRGGVMDSFGMRVDTSMTKVTGRVIQPPELKIANPKGGIISMTLEVGKPQWNLKGGSMVEGKPLKCWGFLYFADSKCQFKSEQFIKNLRKKCGLLGIRMEKPACSQEFPMSTLRKYDSLCELLQNIDYQVQKECEQRLQILLCVMADKDSGYKSLKLIAETKVGVVTQCCLRCHANDAKDHFLTNLAFKMNAKIGGSNVELMNRLPNFEGESHVMFIGADVNHPPSRDTSSPSIAAVVATVNWPAANRYAARVCAQGHRVEKILNFGRICLELVSYYNKLNKVWPEKIVIFRDGVSESQFNMVLTEELQDLKSVFGDSNHSPTITLIVAQKRHQTRFFVKGKSFNVLPGTVVDTEVVHPYEFDFYLFSHKGISGTSKPTHYHVLWDEHKFTSDDLQKLIYEMCFTFAKCTGPVSLVPPVYYADLAAYRGRVYYEAMNEAKSDRSATTVSSSSFSALNDEGCYKLHPDVENLMFFI
ncbi:hypothetical protein V8G54_000271 [Vigna mungo]|uniref:Uncharacterized protein n=1 Tax=Vigna mungo TaxID=3915 RepID=A0AAQ3P6S9_VIGMU